MRAHVRAPDRLVCARCGHEAHLPSALHTPLRVVTNEWCKLFYGHASGCQLEQRAISDAVARTATGQQKDTWRVLLIGAAQQLLGAVSFAV